MIIALVLFTGFSHAQVDGSPEEKTVTLLQVTPRYWIVKLDGTNSVLRRFPKGYEKLTQAFTRHLAMKAQNEKGRARLQQIEAEVDAANVRFEVALANSDTATAQQINIYLANLRAERNTIERGISNNLRAMAALNKQIEDYNLDAPELTFKVQPTRNRLHDMPVFLSAQ